MIRVRKRDSIRHVDGGWFSSAWHFSFAYYEDPDHTGFGSLRVFNDTTFRPGAAWSIHPHDGDERIVYIVEGAYRSGDDADDRSVLPTGSAQRLTLGDGTCFSEGNHSDTEPLRYIEMWITPGVAGQNAAVQQKVFNSQERADRLLPIATPDGNGTVRVHQTASVFVSTLERGSIVGHELFPGAGVYCYLVRGAVTLNGVPLAAGDAALVEQEERLLVQASEPSEVMMVEVLLEDIRVAPPTSVADGADDEDEDEEVRQISF